MISGAVERFNPPGAGTAQTQRQGQVSFAIHGDTVLVTAHGGAHHALDRDEVVQAATFRPHSHARSG